MNALAPMLSFSWLSVGYSLAAHIWQSTLFAGVAAGLTLVLRRNRAQTRYWLWFIASLKFLVPFSLLITLGAHLPWVQGPVGGASRVSFVMEEVNRPFASTVPAQAAASPAHASGAVTPYLVPAGLLTVWLCGCVATLFFWWRRWRRITGALRRASLVKSGREFETLQRVARSAQIGQMPALAISESSFEPGIVGVFRPVMVLPAGIADRLTDSQLEAILSHELCHARRRDNLVAALHMTVEALFWFHPLVWWIGARLVDERERACDEEVLALGSKPQVYAEGILKVCEFCLETPLACVAGVTGSNLKKRIEAIMIHRIARKLEIGKKLLLAVVAAVAILAPVVFGLLHPLPSRAESQAQSATSSTPGFGSVSIQPNTNGRAMPPFNIVAGPNENFVGFKFSDSTFLATHATLPQIIRMAYGVLGFQVAGGPDWLTREKYDVDARFLNGLDDAKFWTLPQEEQTRRMDQRRLQLQSLLADRFKLVIHRETKQLPVYSLTIAVNGPKLHEASPGDAYPNGVKRRDGVPMGSGLWVPRQGVLLGQGVSTGVLAAHLAQQFGRAIVDNTGLTGKYDFKLEFATGKDESAALLSAIPEQLGLQLTPQTGPVEMIVIDRAERAESAGASAGLLHPASSQAQSLAQSSGTGAIHIDSASIQPSDTEAAKPGVTEEGKPVVSSRMIFAPDRFKAANVTLVELIRAAFGVQKSQISGGPDWINTNLYDEEVRFTAAQGTDHIQGVIQLRLELRNLLADRFKLRIHRELKQLNVYELAVGPGGSKLAEAKTSSGAAKPLPSLMQQPPGHFTGKAIDIATLVPILEWQLGTPVIDKTGLKGAYDFSFVVEGGPQQLTTDPAPLLRAVSEQLGLELKPARDLVEVLVIDHAEPVTNGNKNLAGIYQ